MSLHTVNANTASLQTALQPFDSKSKPEWYKLRTAMMADIAANFSHLRSLGTFGLITIDELVDAINSIPSVAAYKEHAPNKPHAKAVVRSIISEAIRSYIDGKEPKHGNEQE